MPLVTLVVLDGWGCAPPGPGNAVELAATPRSSTRSGRATRTRSSRPRALRSGLPDGQMGNSEVGHLTIGSGRILYQDLVRVNRAVEDGSFFENEALLGAFRRAKQRGGAVHLLGLVSYGGVHSHIDHLRALLELARREGMEERTWIHAFTDGRDVSPTSAVDDLAELPAERIATVCGRYYAMDRDKRWERTDRAFAAICLGGTRRPTIRSRPCARATSGASPTSSSSRSPFAAGRGCLPGSTPRSSSTSAPTVRASSSQRLLEHGVDLTTMTRYRDDFQCPVAFEEQEVPRDAGRGAVAARRSASSTSPRRRSTRT